MLTCETTTVPDFPPDFPSTFPSTWTAPANEYRTRIGQWMQQVPTGGAWKSFGSAFVLFLMHAAQKADADGTNLHRPPSNEWFARSCRTSKDSIPRFYRAAAEAGLMVLTFGPTGARVRGYACVLPLGGTPRWPAALAVLREDPRRVRQAERRAAVPASAPVPVSAPVPASAPARVPAPVPAGPGSARADLPSARVPGARSAARADFPGRGSGEFSSARAESDKSAGAGAELRTCGPNQEVTYQVRKMAEVVGAVTTPRAQALLSGEGSGGKPAGPVRPADPADPDRQESVSEPRHQGQVSDRAPAGAAAPAPPAVPPRAVPAGPVASGAGDPPEWLHAEVIRPGLPGWDDMRAGVRAVRERVGFGAGGGRRR